MCLSGGVASAATTITDPAGDANGGANAGVDQATGPVNDAARDLTKAVISTDGSALIVSFTTSAPVDQGAAQTFLSLNVDTPKCSMIKLEAYIGGTDSNQAPAFLPIVDDFDCGGFLSSEGYSVTQSGTTVTARFPYAALAANGVALGASTPLTHLRAWTSEGTAVYGASSCGGDPTFCDLLNYRHREYLVAQIDRTAEAASFTPRRRHR